jgi:hypothetical protein
MHDGTTPELVSGIFLTAVLPRAIDHVQNTRFKGIEQLASITQGCRSLAGAQRYRSSFCTFRKYEAFFGDLHDIGRLKQLISHPKQFMNYD